jgi:hypothetical protein
MKEDSSTSSDDTPTFQKTPRSNGHNDLEEVPHVVRHLNQVTLQDMKEHNYKKNPKLLNEPSVQSQILQSAVPPRLRKEEYQKIKSNSTSSLFVDFTIGNPVMSEIIECLARALYYNIKQSEAKGSPPPGPITLVFSEERFPLNNDFDLENSPSLNRIKYFLSLIFNGEKLSAECAVMALAYIDRLLSLTNIHLHASNWRRITLGAIILASKVWEDQAVWNVDFLNVFPYISVDDLNRIERQYLNAIQYMVTLKSSVYTKYFLDLRSLSEKSNFPLEPLSDEQLKNLELKSQNIEDEFNVNLPNRSRSEDIRDNHHSTKKNKKPQ